MKGGLSATRVMLIAIAAGVIGRWANNTKALPSIGGMLEVIGALVLISLLDTGSTQPVAKGFAWLFFTAVMLSADSPLTGLAKAESAGSAKAPTAARNNSDQPLPTLGPKGSAPQVGRNTTVRSTG